jgi:uncharacterized membrane protein
MVAAFVAAIFVRPPGGFFRSIGAFMPPPLRSPIAIITVGLVLLLPMVFDGGLQIVSTYNSAIAQRLVTGFLYGIGQAGIVIGLIAAIIPLIKRIN